MLVAPHSEGFGILVFHRFRIQADGAGGDPRLHALLQGLAPNEASRVRASVLVTGFGVFDFLQVDGADSDPGLHTLLQSLAPNEASCVRASVLVTGLGVFDFLLSLVQAWAIRGPFTVRGGLAPRVTG